MNIVTVDGLVAAFGAQAIDWVTDPNFPAQVTGWSDTQVAAWLRSCAAAATIEEHRLETLRQAAQDDRRSQALTRADTPGIEWGSDDIIALLDALDLPTRERYRLWRRDHPAAPSVRSIAAIFEGSWQKALFATYGRPVKGHTS